MIFSRKDCQGGEFKVVKKGHSTSYESPKDRAWVPHAGRHSCATLNWHDYSAINVAQSRSAMWHNHATCR